MGDVISAIFSGGLSEVASVVAGGGESSSAQVAAPSGPDVPTASGAEGDMDKAKRRKMVNRGKESTILDTGSLG